MPPVDQNRVVSLNSTFRREPDWEVRRGYALQLHDVPAPLAIIDERGRLLDTNDRFRALQIESVIYKPEVCKELARLYAECHSEGHARAVIEIDRGCIVLEATWCSRDFQGAPVFASIEPRSDRVIETLPALCDIAWSCDVDGRILDLSSDALRLLGRSPVVFRGRVLSDIFKVERGDSLEASQVFKSRRGFKDLLVRLPKHDGKRRWLSLSGIPRYSDDGSFRGYAGIGHDVTGRREAESKLRAAERALRGSAKELRRANAELQLALAAARRSEELKATFLANLNHEFHTPLNAIIGTGEMLALGLAGQEPESARESGARVALAGRQLTGLFDDILEMARIEAGDHDLSLEAFDIAAVVAQEIDRALMDARQAGVDASGLNAVPNVWAFGDSTATARILRCLLDNAVKFTRADGRIGLQAFVDDADRTIGISVWDEGLGVPESVQESIFEPFHRGQSALVSGGSGTGLGLAMARAFARLQDGELEIEKTGPQGSRFRLMLPLAET